MNHPKQVESNIVYAACMTIIMFIMCMLAFVLTSDSLSKALLLLFNVVWLICVFRCVWEWVEGLNEYYALVFKVNMDAEREIRENLIKKYEG